MTMPPAAAFQTLRPKAASEVVFGFIQGLGFRVQGLGLGLRVEASGFGVHSSGISAMSRLGGLLAICIFPYRVEAGFLQGFGVSGLRSPVVLFEEGLKGQATRGPEWALYLFCFPFLSPFFNQKGHPSIFLVDS